jgi:hypothetical protein
MFGDPLPHRHSILLWFRMTNFKLFPFSITTGSVTVVPFTTLARTWKNFDIYEIMEILLNIFYEYVQF